MIQTGFESKVKVQQIINNQLPSFLLDENPKSVDFLKHDPNQKNAFSSGVTLLKVREALKELYTLDRPLYDMFKNLSKNYLNKTLGLDPIKSKTYCLGS